MQICRWTYVTLHYLVAARGKSAGKKEKREKGAGKKEKREKGAGKRGKRVQG